ncbi:hypothetical protein QTH97_27955 [Variovorax sp. J22R24]|uniref:hypothetical protein n=1 Tax=Variovorax gracilis TaxID=3053502 RepID=UPI002575D535|nr:hypothetical protein [Variovorax sp. J22R24]MDM0108806.1 hypothetical protein [Variovorax sp. J22R24]
MRTDVFRALGSDGRVHVVFRRTQTFVEKTTRGVVEKQREPRFYLGNGDPLDCADRYDTFKTLQGDLVVRLLTPNPPKLRPTSQGRQVPEENWTMASDSCFR